MSNDNSDNFEIDLDSAARFREIELFDTPKAENKPEIAAPVVPDEVRVPVNPDAREVLANATSASTVGNAPIGALLVNRGWYVNAAALQRAERFVDAVSGLAHKAETTTQEIYSALATVGMERYAPTPGSDKKYLGLAIAATATKLRLHFDCSRRGPAQTCRYVMGSKDGLAGALKTGEPYGVSCAVFEMNDGVWTDSIGDQAIIDAVQTEFERQRNEVVVKSGEFNQWFSKTLEAEFGAIYAKIQRRFIRLHDAGDAGLALMLASSLAEKLNAVIEQVASNLDDNYTLSTRTSNNAYDKLSAILDKCRAMRTELGDYYEVIFTKTRELRSSLDRTTDSTAIRGMQLELD